MANDKLYVYLAQTIGARARCIRDGNTEWTEKHENVIEQIRRMLPRGSGFDNGSQIDLERSTEEKIVINTAFHHMDEYGSYDGWTEHTVTVRPSLAFGFRLTISGQNRNDIKTYIGETFDYLLSREVDTLRVGEEVEVSLK